MNIVPSSFAKKISRANPIDDHRPIVLGASRIARFRLARVTLIGASRDEVAMPCKNIWEVMAAQSDLVRSQASKDGQFPNA
jgi:hypothetical protein